VDPATERRKILIQFDGDPQPSVFDRVVAVDAGADEVFAYGGVKPEQVRDLVHGAIFTRGPKHLHFTALFIGGSDVKAGEQLLAEARKHMLPQFGLRVSVMLDANGANTTAAAAVRVAARHLDLTRICALVLGGTGPVGQRAALLLASAGAAVGVASRQLDRATAVANTIRERIPQSRVQPLATATPEELQAAVAGRNLIIAAGAAGVQLLPASVRCADKSLRVAIDLNAVPPVGIEGLAPHDIAAERDGVLCYGALGVGETKMKLHKAAVARLFKSNDQVLDALEIYALALSM
jgi:hypothetical protein